MKNCIAEYRLRRGLTQEKLAQLCDITKNCVYDIEKGSSPRIDTVYKLCEALNCNVVDLFPDFGLLAAKLSYIAMYKGLDYHDNAITELLHQIERLCDKINSIRYEHEGEDLFEVL